MFNSWMVLPQPDWALGEVHITALTLTPINSLNLLFGVDIFCSVMTNATNVKTSFMALFLISGH
jgi:hypothetical protein